jgi:hypothetical protein
VSCHATLTVIRNQTIILCRECGAHRKMPDRTPITELLAMCDEHDQRGQIRDMFGVTTRV